MEISNEQQLECTVGVVNSLGIHARAAARIAEVVGGFDCRVLLRKDDVEAEADSVLSILALDAPKGSSLIVLTSGPQAAEAMDALTDLFEQGFGEE